MIIAFHPPVKSVTKPDLDALDAPDAPYPVNSVVCLKCAPSQLYTVESVQVSVDVDGNQGHIRNPNEGTQHYYKLRTESDGVAHWWHHQLELVF